MGLISPRECPRILRELRLDSGETEEYLDWSYSNLVTHRDNPNALM